jgi:hypothetical protein
MLKFSFCVLQELLNPPKTILNLISTQASHLIPVIAVIDIAHITSLILRG